MKFHDPTIFQRSGSSFVLSQRFKHICNSLYGTFKVTLQMLSTNAILRCSPRPVGYFLLVLYLFLVTTVCLLLLKQLHNQRIKEYKDFDLFEVIRTRNKVVRSLEINFLFQIAFILFNVVFIFGVLNEKWGTEFLPVQFVILMLLFINSLRNDQKSERTYK